MIERAMVRMEYTGRLTELRGKQALVRQDPNMWKGYTVANVEKFALAQFAEEGLTHNGVRMDWGWHHFMLDDFTPVGSKPVF